MKYAKWTVLFFSLALVSWLILLFVNPSNFELIFLVLCSALTIAFVDFFFVWLCALFARKRGSKFSAYKIFAIIDICIGLLIAIYAVWDIRTDSGWFAGLAGALLLIFVEPVVLVLLLTDYIIWRVRGRGKF